ncbi:hypothetical protein [Brevibacillus choshinensis]|uniref:hypothetical protein n=1 Tax=Brevibacillus choshinensis TaxID=54911 RepID=UPI002E1E21AB|nr:hypothetical protein [Brevibacillus choshinensis]
MFTIEKYIDSIKENLQKNSDTLVENIKQILDFQFYNEIELLDFEAFNQPFNLSIMMFSMDRQANEVFYEGKDNNVFSGSHQLLQGVEYYNLPDDKSNEFWEFYEQSEEELSKGEEQLIVDWFVECWNKANGSSIKFPAYFVFHDDIKSLDLHKNK